MSSRIQEHITSDGKIFETLLDLGDTNAKDYSLYHLEMAEARVKKGTNKTIQAALNSSRAIAQKNSSGRNQFSNKIVDEYGLDRTFYTKGQIEFVHDKIEEYKEDYEAATPFERDTIVTMAKTSLKMNILEGQMMGSNDKKIVEQYTSLRKSFSDMAGDLKSRPKDSKDEDRSKSRTSLSQIVLNYENRIKSGEMERSEATDIMRTRLSEERVKAMDGRFEDVSEDD